MVNKTWRGEAEMMQTLSRSHTFTHTNTTDASETVITLRMEEGSRVSFVVYGNDAYVNFDAAAVNTDPNSDGTIESMFVPAGTGYFEDNIYIDSTITMINASAGANASIRGIVWGR